jgi:acetyl-CoA carboxylase alpha subunit
MASEGRDTKSNVYRNFGMPNPEGNRKPYDNEVS